MPEEHQDHKNHVLLAFYRQEKPDLAGRMITDIWQWNYDYLEMKHDYIQWLFPLLEKSQFNLKAPLLNSAIIEEFKTDIQLQKNLLISLQVMFNFYGLQVTNDHPISINKSPEYMTRKKQWISWRNHNYLRLTRILNCLKLLGQVSYAQALLQCLETIYTEESKYITEETWQYWYRAVYPDQD